MVEEQEQKGGQERGQEGGQEGLEDTGSGREKRKGQVKDAMQSCLIYNDFQRRSKMQTSTYFWADRYRNM